MAKATFYTALQGQKLPTMGAVSAIVRWCGGDPSQWMEFHRAMTHARQQRLQVEPWILTEQGYPVLADGPGTSSPQVMPAVFTPAPPVARPANGSAEERMLADLGEDYDLTVRLDDGLSTVDRLAEYVTSARRMAIVGRAGSGKTVVVLRTLEMLRMNPAMAAVVIRSDWATTVGDRLLAIDVDGVHRDWRICLDILLEAAVSDISVERFEQLATDHPMFLVVDSVNSASSTLARRIIEVVDLTVRNLPNVSVIVTDRNVDRYPTDGKWRVAEICGVERNIAAATIDAQFGSGTWAKLRPSAHRLLALPFFLNLSTHGSDPTCSSRADALSAFFTNRAMLTAERIDTAAAATVAAYRAGSRRLKSSALAPDMLAALVEAGVLNRDPLDPSFLTFSHELFGDYLASRVLVDAESWPPGELDALTFSKGRWRVDGLSGGASSFDVVILAGQQLADTDIGDRFLCAVYEWNWRAAVECMSTTDPLSGPFSRSARAAVLGLLCERLSDPIDGTRGRARRLLCTLPDSEARELANLTGRGARNHLPSLFVDRADRYSDWFAEWCGVFSRPDTHVWDCGRARALFDANTLLGWTVSYALRRGRLPIEISHWLVGAYDAFSIGATDVADDRLPVRWRAIHALAAGDGPETLSCLMRAFDSDPFPWVRWEAARSTTVFAARADEELSTLAIESLRERIDRMAEGVAQEIAWVARYHGATTGFASRMRPLIVELATAASDDAAQVRWAARLRRFDEFWSRTAD